MWIWDIDLLVRDVLPSLTGYIAGTNRAMLQVESKWLVDVAIWADFAVRVRKRLPVDDLFDKNVGPDVVAETWIIYAFLFF